ncbi:MAG TPA: ABC transporter substrate-binding protein [Candidatus Sulfotelmatobacter sp.]|jgi:branched-chain amino acid transport system substrate-binding protein|nr:ABC transporter substrate-binding protein [Candidatus Sulfotelmatobacter sp.]
MRREWWRNTAAAAMLAAGLALSASAAEASGSPDLNVAFIGSLSGPDAIKAQDALDGFKLGVKHLGGRLGGVEFDLVSFDDRHSVDTARNLMEKVQRDLRPQFTLVSSDAKTLSVLGGMADASHTFMIALDAPATAMAGKECRPYVFSLAALSDTVHEQAGLYMAGQGYRRVLLAMPSTPTAQAAADAFRRGFKAEVLTMQSRRGEMNFAQELRRIADAKPDAVYLLETGGMGVNFVRQFDEEGLKGEVPLFGPIVSFDQAALAAAAPASLDLFSVGPWSEDSDSPANRRMMSDFEGEYGRPASYHAAMGYDAAMLIDAAMRGADKKFNNDEMVRTAIRRSDFASTRPGFRFDTNQFPIQSYLLRSAQRDARGHVVNEQRGTLQRDVRDGHASECPMRWVAEQPPAAPAKP